MSQEDEEKNEMDIFLEWLSPEREKAEEFYLQLRGKLVFTFRFYEDPEDLAGEVIKRALNNIEKGKVEFGGIAEHYILRIAHFVKKEQARKRILISIDDMINDPPTTLQESSFPEELYQILEKCLEALEEDEREIFLDYTFAPDDIAEKQHRQNVAKKWNKTIKHLRVKIHRIKNKLRACAMKKLKEEE